MRRITEVVEASSTEEANKLMKEGWVYIATNTSTHPTVYILGKINECE